MSCLGSAAASARRRARKAPHIRTIRKFVRTREAKLQSNACPKHTEQAETTLTTQQGHSLKQEALALELASLHIVL